MILIFNKSLISLSFRNFTTNESTVRQILSELQLKKKIKAMENNLNAFTRVQGDKENITVVKQMPKVEAAKQPTIAIITRQYYEKMAVDAMMTNRQTFVRYATVGGYFWKLCTAFTSYFVLCVIFTVFLYIIICKPVSLLC